MSSAASGALARIRAKKAAAAAAAGENDASIDIGSNERDASAGRKRLELQQMRENARLEAGSNAGGGAKQKSSISSIRSRLQQSRSETPVRSLRKRASSDGEDSGKDGDENADNDDDSDSDDEKEGNENSKGAGNRTSKVLVDDSIEDQSVVSFELPPHLFPLTFASKGRQQESAIQPILAIPAPFPKMLSSVNGVWSREAADTLKFASKDLVDNFDIERLLGNIGVKHGMDPDENAPLLFQPEESPIEDASAFELSSTNRVFDGMHVGHASSLSELQLRAEEFAMISGVVGGSTTKELGIPQSALLSRATQRLAREVHAMKEVNELRVKSSATALRENLLQRDPKVGVALRIPEDPIESSHSSEPSVPEPTLAFGGELGQWGERGSDGEKLGAILKASRHNFDANRTALNLHIRGLVLDDHPLFIEEERLAVRLKHLHTQYSVLYERGAVFYLVRRLSTEVESLERLLRQPIDPSDEETEAFIAYLARDIVETLPPILELKKTAESLTASIYETWKSIKEARSSQGFASTRAMITVISLGELGSGKGGVGGGEDDVREADRVWQQLRSRLTDLPDLVQQAYARESPKRSNGPSATADADGDINADNGSNSVDQTLVATDHLRTIQMLVAVVAELQGKELPRSSGGAGGLGGAGFTRRTRDREAAAGSAVEGASGRKLQSAAISPGLIPDFVLRLTDDGGITADVACPLEEQSRRRTIQKTVFRVNLSIAKLRSDDFSHLFQLSLLHQPSDLKIELHTNIEGSWSSDCIVSSIIVSIPGQQIADMLQTSTASNNKKLPVAAAYIPISAAYTFTSESPFAVATSMLGTMVMKPVQDGAAGQKIAGSVFCITEYDAASSPLHNSRDGIRANQLAHLPMSSAHSVAERYRSAHIRDFSREKDFIRLMPKLSELDVNDPRNEHLVCMLLAAGGVITGRTITLSSAFSGDKEIFRLATDEYGLLLSEQGVSYANYLKFQQGIRIKLLQLRTKKPFLFSEPIPLAEAVLKRSDLYKSLLHSAYKGDSTENGKIVIETPKDGTLVSGSGSEVDMDPDHISNKAKLSDFLRRIRDIQTNLPSRTRKFVMTSHVVSEIDVTPRFDFLQFFNLSWLIPDPIRKLKPSSAVRTPQVIQVRKCDLLVQVVSARSVPIKVPSEAAGGDAPGLRGRSLSTSKKDGSARARARPRLVDGGVPDDDYDDGDDTGEAASRIITNQSIHSFVEIRFQEDTARTSAVAGTAPIWKQTLKLPFRAPQDDFSPSSLEQVRDEVFISIFDEVAADDSARGGFLEGENTERVEKRFLGSLSVPFSTICSEGKIEGVFRVKTPAFNWGYARESSEEASGATQESADVDAIGSGVGEDTALIPAAPPGMASSLLTCFGLLTTIQQLNSSSIKDTGALDRIVETEFDSYASSRDTMLLKIMITLDPLIMTENGADNDDDEMSSSAVSHIDRPLLGYALKWLSDLRDYSQYTAKRSYSLFCTDSSYQRVFIPRFLTAMRPPMGIDSLRGCIHLVAQLPFAKDSQAHVGAMDVWCNANQVWEIIAGDEEEHATLLFNYLYYLILKKNSSSRDEIFLALGKAVPEGNTVYVVMRESVLVSGGPSSSGRPSEFLVINPITGYIFSAADFNCPLNEIACLVTPENVYANIQKEGKPCKISFDISRNDCWRPFFGKQFPLPQVGISTIQKEVDYFPTLPSTALEIERAISTAVKNGMRRWRSQRKRSTTTFHPEVSSIVRDLLSTMDDHMLGRESLVSLGSTSSSRERTDTLSGRGLSSPRKGRSSSSAPIPGVLSKFQQAIQEKMNLLLRNRELHGYPINIPFTDVNEVAEYVRALCVHEVNHPEVQFVFAVRAFPYTNNMVSLWLFLGSLESIS